MVHYTSAQSTIRTLRVGDNPKNYTVLILRRFLRDVSKFAMKFDPLPLLRWDSQNLYLLLCGCLISFHHSCLASILPFDAPGTSKLLCDPLFKTFLRSHPYSNQTPSQWRWSWLDGAISCDPTYLSFSLSKPEHSARLTPSRADPVTQSQLICPLSSPTTWWPSGRCHLPMTLDPFSWYP